MLYRTTPIGILAHSLLRRWLQQQSTGLAPSFMKDKRTMTNVQTFWPKPLGLLLHHVDSNQLLHRSAAPLLSRCSSHHHCR